MATKLECLKSLPGDLVIRDLAAVRNEVVKVAEPVAQLHHDADGYEVRTGCAVTVGTKSQRLA